MTDKAGTTLYWAKQWLCFWQLFLTLCKGDMTQKFGYENFIAFAQYILQWANNAMWSFFLRCKHDNFYITLFWSLNYVSLPVSAKKERVVSTNWQKFLLVKNVHFDDLVYPWRWFPGSLFQFLDPKSFVTFKMTDPCNLRVSLLTLVNHFLRHIRLFADKCYPDAAGLRVQIIISHSRTVFWSNPLHQPCT